MKYNFDEIVNRKNTNAMNTDGFRSYIFHAGPEKKFPFKDDEFIRMWVADMEFATPPAICQAIKERVDRRIFGYSMVFDSGYYKALNRWCQKLYDWHFPKEELVFSAGVIPALYELVGELVGSEGKMLIITPSYGFFKHAADYNGAQLVRSSLRRDDKGHFSLDLDDFEKKAADTQMRLILWCNPHNPTGRMWTREELEQVGEIARKHNLWLISDEIHCDLIRQGKKHIPMGKIMPDYPRLITCMSASKTFNMAGFMFANIIIRDETVRQKFCANDKNIGFVNPLSIAAHQAAYEQGAEWLNQLKTYLDQNFQYLDQYLKHNLPQAVFEIPEATYLAWVDLSAYLGDVSNLPLFFANEAGVLLEGGDDLFVGNASGYIRLNLAMPRATIQKGLEQINQAILKHTGSKAY